MMNQMADQKTKEEIIAAMKKQHPDLLDVAEWFSEREFVLLAGSTNTWGSMYDDLIVIAKRVARNRYITRYLHI